MELGNTMKSLKYVPKIWTAFCYPIMLIMSLLLFLGRNFENVRIGIVLEVFPDFYNHISNFSLCFIIYATIGYVGVMLGMTLKHILLTGIGILFFTLIIELLVVFLNTPDKTDAVYGICGVLMGFAFLLIIKKYGLKINELYQANA